MSPARRVGLLSAAGFFLYAAAVAVNRSGMSGLVAAALIAGVLWALAPRE